LGAVLFLLLQFFSGGNIIYSEMWHPSPKFNFSNKTELVKNFKFYRFNFRRAGLRPEYDVLSYNIIIDDFNVVLFIFYFNASTPCGPHT
jgi:hypothetical protein